MSDVTIIHKTFVSERPNATHDEGRRSIRVGCLREVGTR